MTAAPNTTPPAQRQHRRLTGRQKLLIWLSVGGIALAAVILTHLPGGGAEPPEKSAQQIGSNLPFQAPAAPAVHHASVPRPRHFAFPPIPRHALAAPPQDKALRAPIWAYGTTEGGKVPNAAGGATRGHGASASDPPEANDGFTRLMTASGTGGKAIARVIPHQDMTILAGTLIPCTLQTAINSSLPGFVDCVLPVAVPGMTGAVTLLDKGTKILGEIRSGLGAGQERLFILWTRAVTPEGVSVALASPAADSLGRSGVSGAVDTHFWKRFGAAIMFSVIGAAPQIASSALQHGNGNSYNILGGAGSAEQVPDTILQRTMNLPPTLEKNQGDTVSIFVARDLDFSRVYGISEASP